MNIVMSLMPCILSMLIGAVITGLLVRYIDLPTFLVYQIGYFCGFIGLLIAVWKHLDITH